MSARPSAAAHYGEGNADIYDLVYPRIDRGVLQCLTELAAGRPALALGVGTGRCAAGLIARGLRVCGVDASAAMLQRCRRRAPKAELIRADLAALPFAGGFGMAYSLVSTLSLLVEPGAQQACLQGVAAALDIGGVYVDESSLVPDSDHCEPTDLDLPMATRPPARYRVRYLPISATRLQQLAVGAGLSLRWRWRNWLREPWRPGDTEAISVYQRT